MSGENNYPLPGPLMVDVGGTSLTAEDRAFLANPLIGGLILFSRNYESLPQLTELVRQIRDINPGILIAVDHEGGRVQRFKTGFTRIPPMGEIGRIFQRDSDAGLMLGYNCGWLFASELLSVGIDFSFAPVLDVDYGVSTVIGDRSFSAKPNEICMLAEQLVAGMRDAGMAATGKHFPGHGFVQADSHLEIPRDHRAFEAIKANDMMPFDYLIPRGLNAVMPAHVIYDQIDDSPAGFSSFWLKTVLRESMKFDGVIFSDDLTMEGASVAGGYAQRAAAALAAGCDMLLVCNHRKGAMEALEYLEDQEGATNFTVQGQRLAKMRGRRRVAMEALCASSDWLRASEQLALWYKA